MKTILRLLVISFFFVSCSREFQVQNRTGESPIKEMYSFPILVGGDEKICEAINNELSSSYLNLKLGEESKSIFEKIWSASEDQMPERTDLAYRVEYLGAKLYSVNITGFYVGAYLNPIDEYRNFDLRTGREIYLDTLFSPDGEQKICNELSLYKKGLLDEKIQFAREQMSKENMDMDERTQYAEMYDMYVNCSSTIDGLTPVSFYRKGDSLFFVLDPCSVHYNRGLDELGTFYFGQALSQLKPHLSSYGKDLLK